VRTFFEMEEMRPLCSIYLKGKGEEERRHREREEEGRGGGAGEKVHTTPKPGAVHLLFLGRGTCVYRCLLILRAEPANHAVWQYYMLVQ
jgi:hypothetical protein